VPLGCNVRYSGISNREEDLLEEHGKIKFFISTVMIQSFFFKAWKKYGLKEMGL
jgi:hypothetical protein